MVTINLLDETTRPKAPKIEGATRLHRAIGQRLAMIHRLHLQEIDGVRAMVDAIEADYARAADLVEAVPELEMARNYRRFGAMCGRECQMLSFHHTSEDTEIFPHLRREGSEGLRRVVDRLAEEHLVIHALIEDLGQGASAILSLPGREAYDRLRKTFGELERFVRSHFRYEETELEEALGYHDVLI